LKVVKSTGKLETDLTTCRKVVKSTGKLETDLTTLRKLSNLIQCRFDNFAKVVKSNSMQI